MQDVSALAAHPQGICTTQHVVQLAGAVQSANGLPALSALACVPCWCASAGCHADRRRSAALHGETPPECHAIAVRAPWDLMSRTDSRLMQLAVRSRHAGHAPQLYLAAVQVSDAVQSASASAAYQLEAEQTHAAATFAEGGQAWGPAAADASHAAGQDAADAATEATAQEAAERLPTAVADAPEQSPSLAARVRQKDFRNLPGLFAKRMHTAGPGSVLKCLGLFWGDTAAGCFQHQQTAQTCCTAAIADQCFCMLQQTMAPCVWQPNGGCC